MLHLLAFCGLGSAERDIIPKIWTNLQTTKDWFSAGTELTKWFRLHDIDGDKDYQFHKELMDDIRKMMFYLGSTPLADNAHCEISPLAFGFMPVAEENQLWEDQEARDKTTALTPTAVRASKRKCPSIPTTFPELNELLTRYIYAGHSLFTIKCHHFQKVVRMRQELRLMHRRNMGQLPPNTISSLVWDVVTDAAQFFNFFLTT